MNTQLNETETTLRRPPAETWTTNESGTSASRKRALVDLSILGLVFWGTFGALRIAGVEIIGFWTILAGVGTGAALIAVRKESWRDYGVRAGGDAGFVTSRVVEVTILTYVTGFTVIGLATAIGYPPSESIVLTQQPETLFVFLLDIVFGVWIAAAIGEEVFFRGLLLPKFAALFGGGRLALAVAVLAQAIWFGAGHVSQGVSGMIMAGTIGAVLGAFFLTRARRALLPLIIAHGMIDTLSLTINYFS